MIYLFHTEEKITADIKEIYRYSGFKGNTPESDMLSIIKEIKEEIENAANCKLCYTKNELNYENLNFGIGDIHSKSLAKNLNGCESVYIFAATAGVDIDRIIRRYSALSPAKAVIAQATGVALIESLCNWFCKSIIKEEEKVGYYIRPRFSPGYGDFDISYQKEIINILGATKLTGITLTDSLLMVPTKSVTAVMGVSKTNNGCILSGCEVCNKTNCEFRRNGEII